jgi:glycosyltransferase involved in cell wall biosynthesis
LGGAAAASSRAAQVGPLVGWSPYTPYPRSVEVDALFGHDIDPADYDVVWDAGAVLLWQLPRRWDAVPVVADLVDDMVLTYRRQARTAPGLLARLRWWKAAFVFARFEREVMRRAAHCVVVSDEDARSFARVSPRVPVSVIGNGVDTEHFRPLEVAEVPGRIVFECTMSFPPNEQAALYLVREVMPRVWERRPDATVALVGRDPGPALRVLAGPGVEVTGSVPDVREHVLRAEVFASPLVSGSGIKNKVLQAWALQRAVVATPMSLGGLAARPGEELLVRDGAAAFAEGVLELLADPDRRRALGAAGRRAACERFAWDAMAERFEALLLEAARSGRAGVGARR